MGAAAQGALRVLMVVLWPSGGFVQFKSSLQQQSSHGYGVYEIWMNEN